jgi:hypothetical protein
MSQPSMAFAASHFALTAQQIAAAKKATAKAEKDAAAAKKKKAEADRKAKAAEKARKAKEKAEFEKNKPSTEPTLDYKWNLPPHTWSLPVTPIQVEEGMYKADTNLVGVPETYRRGRMWWYANTTNSFVDSDGKEKPQTKGSDRRYGFQFLWNPESYTTSISLNTDTTPSVNDRFVGVAGAFPSGETISFSIRLDRTNDFACLKNLIKKGYTLGNYEGPVADDKNLVEMVQKYYNTGFFNNQSAAERGKQLKELLDLGTVADLEYIYTAVNGPGWKNITGRKTGDIGYLSATLLRIDIGPLSYIGYINSLNVTHISFSQDMTPIRTDVSIAMNLMASAGIQDKKES